MKVVLALVFGALVQGQTAPVAANPAPLPRQAAPAAPSGAIAPPRSGSSSNATLKDRQFFVANPIVDAMLVSTLAPKTSTSASTTDSTTTSTSSSSDLTNTLLMASVLNSGNQQKRPAPRRQYTQAPQYVQTSGPQYVQASGPQYVQASGQYVQASGPQYTQTSVSTQFAPVQTFQQQPQYFAPAPQPRYASAPQRSYHSDSYGYDSGSQRDDPLKKMVLLNGVMSGNVNPMAAVALDNNNKMSSTDALVVSSMGNTPLSTMLAVGAGSGSGGSGNMLGTMLMANALAPKSSSSTTTSASTNSNSALTTLATLSVLGQGSGSQSSGGLFGNMFGGNGN